MRITAGSANPCDEGLIQLPFRQAGRILRRLSLPINLDAVEINAKSTITVELTAE